MLLWPLLSHGKLLPFLIENQVISFLDSLFSCVAVHPCCHLFDFRRVEGVHQVQTELSQEREPEPVRDIFAEYSTGAIG